MFPPTLFWVSLTRTFNIKLQSYDATRVKLSSKLNKRSNDYINANYVTAPWSKKPAHIAAQGPLDGSVHHFWQMVWEQKSSIIVMVTSLVERGVKKCEQYWQVPPLSR